MSIDEGISFRRLEILIAFLENGNLSRTAELLETSTVSVHRALHSLQESVRCPLFVHQGRHLVPTAAAHVLADVGKDVLTTLSKGINATRQAAGYGAGHIKLGSLYSLTIQLVPEVIVGLRSRLPDLQAELILGSNAELLTKLRAGTIDATLMAMPPAEPDVVSVALQEDHMYFAAPLGSPYAGHSMIDLKICTAEQFLSLGEGFATQQGFKSAFQAARFEPNISMQVADIFSLANLVSGGLGYTLLPGRVQTIFQHKIQFIALEEPYRCPHTLGLSFLRARERDPDLLALTAICRKVASEADRRGNPNPPA